MSDNSKVPVTGPHYHDGASAGRLNSSRVFDEIYVAEIQQISPESMSFSVQSRDASGQITDISMNFPGLGYSSAMMLMPELGSLVLLLKLPGIDRYYTLGFLPPDPLGGRRYRHIERWPDGAGDYSDDLLRVVASRLRPMAPGDVYLAASGGSELYMDDDVELHDQMGDEMRIRAADGALMATSRHNYLFANGVWRAAGPIQRNSLKTETNGEPIEGMEATRVVTSDTKEVVYMTDSVAANKEVPVEYRLDVEDRVRLHNPLNDVNSESNVTPRFPVASFIMGNMVGNNEHDADSYGKFLAPAFTEKQLSQSNLTFRPLGRNGSEFEIATKGVAWGFHQDKLSFLGSDKEGVTHRFMSPSRGNDAGLSMETAAKGGRRDFWGKTRDEGLSWEALFTGGIKWSVGKRSSNQKTNQLPRSLELRLAGGSYTEHGYSQDYDPNSLKDVKTGKKMSSYDYGSYAKVERVQGNSREEVSGKSELTVGGDIVWKIGGSFRYSLGGSFVDSSMGDRTINTTAAFSTNSSSIQNTTGSRTEKLVKGNDMKTLMLGNLMEIIVAGNRTTTLAAGNIVEATPAGSKTTTIGTGSHTVVVGAGAISATTGAGAVTMATTAGTVSFAGTLMNVTALSVANITAPVVGLGMLPTRTGVVTMLSHKCYITGLPPIPSLTVTAGM